MKWDKNPAELKNYLGSDSSQSHHKSAFVLLLTRAVRSLGEASGRGRRSLLLCRLVSFVTSDC